MTGRTNQRCVRPVYVVRLRAELDVKDDIKALRALLKIALRRLGLRCVSVEQEIET